MADNTKIEWCHATFNPWRGCTKVSAGCKHCYAETLSKRNPGTLGIWGKRGTRAIAVESYWKQPIKWNRDAQATGERRRVFCASLADVFEGNDTMPEAAWDAVYEARVRLFNLIEATPALDWLLLTKRPENILDMLGDWAVNMPANLWIGTSVENQEEADTRIPHLLRVPAAVRFLSCEPLLGEVDLRLFDAWLEENCYEARGRLHWVIAGGESGGDARPMAPAWARSLRDQCVAAGVAFHFKQWGEYSPYYESVNPTTGRLFQAEYPNGTMKRAGKKAAGRLLDGRTWDELPEVQR